MGSIRTFQRRFIVKQLPKTNQTDIIGAAGFGLPFIAPLSQNELFQLVNTKIEGITTGYIDTSFVEVLAVEFEGMSSA